VSDPKSYHMSSEEFKEWGYAVIDWIADYHETIESRPVRARVKPGEIREKLSPHPPISGEPFDRILEDMETIILPGITHWQSPSFFAFFPANVSGPSILGELLSSGIGVQGMIWATSPACTELETHLMDWLVSMLDLPRKYISTGSGGGVIQDSASSAALCALLAAREEATKQVSNHTGCTMPLACYASSQAHSSIEKAVRIAGIGSDNLRIVDVDSSFAMIPADLERKMRRDCEEGIQPFFVVATIGTTSSNAMDPLRKIGSICRDMGVWLHVDAAMSGTAAVCPEFRFLFDGLELADSFCFNPHKWMFTNFDCDCFFVARKASLIHALSILPEYLRNRASQTGEVIDYRDWQIPLGRRFRALKLWCVIRHYGIEGIRFHVRKHVDLAQRFAKWVNESDDFELTAPVPLNLVCFRHVNGDDFNQELMDTLNNSGDLYITHTRLEEHLTLRLCVGQTNTELSHIEHAWDLIQKTAFDLVRKSR